MSDLTKEHFDEQLRRLVTKDDLAQQLAQQTEALKAYAREQSEDLARMVNEGFEDVHRRLDIIAQVQQIQQTMERKFAKLEEALHIKL
jgi:DNA anti-recombination protein RmuC